MFVFLIEWGKVNKENRSDFEKVDREYQQHERAQRVEFS